MTDESMEPDDDGFDSAMGLSAPSPEVADLLERMLGMAEEGEWDAVAEGLRDALETHPEDPYVLCWLGMAERELGLEGIAYERFRRCLDQEPNDPVLLATAGNALAAFDDPAAEAALRTAALLGPDLAQARWMYGAYLTREGMLEEGLAELRAAEVLTPEDSVVHTEKGVALAMLERMDQAALAFGRAVELEPEDGWSLVLLGLMRIETDDLDDAVPPLDEGARLRPDDLDAQLLAALAHAATGRDDRALEMLERGRLHAEGVDARLVLEAEERIEAGPEAALRFLREAVAPSSLRERLMERP